jgi:hypothetical protein|tara:strand:- start:631 stop:1086 length:456 start_codon:yes stop_codon:yes gene_type:complete
MIDFLRQVKKEYESRMKVEVEDNRLRDNVEHRAAVCNACRPFSTYKDLGKLWDRDHATIVHYRREHEGLLRFSPAYRAKYGVALACVQHISLEMDVSPISNTYINGEEQLRVLDEILSWVGELREKVSNALEKTDMKTYLRDVEVLNENET